jgi:hypothetical protein
MKGYTTRLGIAVAGTSAYLGKRLADSRQEDLQKQDPSTLNVGIGVATTAAVISGMHFAEARYKNPWLTGLGMAITAGTAYASGHILGAIKQKEIYEQGQASGSTRILEGALSLGTLYYSGKALAPYAARTVSRLDAVIRPGLRALGSAIESSEFKNIGEFGSVFARKFELERASYSAGDGRFPIQNYLGLISNIKSEVLNTELQAHGLNDVFHDMKTRFGLNDRDTVHGIRSASLADLMKAHREAVSPDILRMFETRNIPLNNIALGSGVLFDIKANKILNLQRYTAKNIVKDAVLGFEKNFRIPFANFNPITLLRPREVFGAAEQAHSFQHFPAGTPLGPQLKAGPKGAAFIGGHLYDEETGKKLTTGIIVKTGYRKKETGEWIESVFGSVIRQRYGHGAEAIKDAPRNGFFQNMMASLEMDVPGLYKTGHAKMESQWTSFWKDVNKRSAKDKGFFGSLKNVTAHIFHEENITNEFKTIGNKFGDVNYAFVPHSDLPGIGAFWLTERPVRLLETLGIGGFDPRTTRSAPDVIWKMLTKRFLPIYAGYKTLQFADDMSHQFFGYGPSDVPMDALAAITVGSSYMRQGLGITKGAQYLEDLMPGSMTSGISVGSRALGLPMLAGLKFGPKAFWAGTAASVLLGGFGDVTKTAEEYKEEYYGDKRVGIRNGAYWELGTQEFHGGKIKEFLPNYYRRFKSRYQFTDVQYGSEAEYWGNYLDPYHYAEKHYSDRPYPYVSNGLEEVPFIGPAIAPLGGPGYLMHQGYEKEPWKYSGASPEAAIPGPGGLYSSPETPGAFGGGDNIGVGGGLGAGGTGGGTGEGAENFVFMQPTQFGYMAGAPEPMGDRAVDPLLKGLPKRKAIDPNSPKGLATESFYRGYEYLGIYGWLGQQGMTDLTGRQSLFDDPQLESAHRIDSAERSFYQQGWGGMLQTNELFRRFLPHRQRNIDLYNPIENNMPGWIPGSEYMQNFHQGDPYNKAGDFGEIRLPGAGYEKFYTPGKGIVSGAQQLGAINSSYAGSEKQYSMLDAYRILADVAPYSTQYKYSQQYMMAMSKVEMLTPEAEEERKLIRKEVTKKKKHFEFTPRKFTSGDTSTENLTVDKYLGRGSFLAEGHGEHVYKLAGLKGITPEGEKEILKYLHPGANVSAQVLDDDRYKEKTSTVLPTTPILVGDLNRRLITGDMAEYKKTGPGDIFDPLNKMVQYNGMERAVGTAWESISHSNLGWVSAKFLHKRTPLEEWERSQVYGRETADWGHPVRDFFMPVIERVKSLGPLSGIVGGGAAGYMFTKGRTSNILGSIVGAALGGAFSLTHSKSYIPDYRNKEWDINQYFDMLKFVKNKRLYEWAKERAIADEGIDPEKLINSVDASKDARHALQKAIEHQHGELALLAKEAKTPEDKTYYREKAANLAKNTSFLHAQKWTEDETLTAMNQGYTGAALEYRKNFMSTMFGADPHGDFASIMRAIPTKQREFFQAFVQAPKEDREKIKKITPLGMRRFLEAKWGEDVEKNPDIVDYFKQHQLPGLDWVGWNPGVALDDVKYRTVQQEGLELHDFNLWQSQGAQLQRKPYVPLVDPLDTTNNVGDIKRELNDIMGAQGYNNYDIYVNQRPGVNQINLQLDVKYATNGDAKDYISNNIGKIVSPAMTSSYR